MFAALIYLLSNHALLAFSLHASICLALTLSWAISSRSGTWPKLPRWNRIPNFAVLHAATCLALPIAIWGIASGFDWMLIALVVAAIITGIAGLATVIMSALGPKLPTAAERNIQRPAVIALAAFVTYCAGFVWSMGLGVQPQWLTTALYYLPYAAVVFGELTFVSIVWHAMGLRLPRTFSPQAYTVVQVAGTNWTPDLATALANSITWRRHGAATQFSSNNPRKLILLGAYAPQMVIAKAAELGQIVLAEIVYGDEKPPFLGKKWMRRIS